MIHGTEPALQVSSWQRLLRGAFRHPRELLDYLKIDPRLLTSEPLLNSEFAMRVPRGYADRMRPGDPHDPLLRQVLPVAAERTPGEGFVTDPVADQSVAPVPGLLHKYHGRALLLVSGACAVHCRYCFRRHYPYQKPSAGGGHWDRAINYLSQSPDLSEVILSGGDPLMLTDDQLAGLVRQLASIPHIRRLRVHTRLPVVLPERITPALVRCLSPGRLKPVVVLHINHPREASGQLQEALRPLALAGVTLLNQSVLLKGVNDDAGTLCELSEALLGLSVLPYYLHLLDRVSGAAHFEVTEPRARLLQQEVMSRLPGYLVPRLVREQPGRPSKSLLL